MRRGPGQEEAACAPGDIGSGGDGSGSSASPFGGGLAGGRCRPSPLAAADMSGATCERRRGVGERDSGAAPLSLSPDSGAAAWASAPTAASAAAASGSEPVRRCLDRPNAEVNRRRRAGTGAPSQPLFGVHAARALLSGPEGRPEQAGWLLGAGEGGGGGCFEPRASSDHAAVP